MPLDSLGNYLSSHKTWDHVGNMIPNVEHSEGVRPALGAQPAEWLPVQFFDKYMENWMVVMPGKILSADNNGHLVPAQYALAGATITYTSDDVDAGVVDVRTGDLLVAGDTGTFNVSDVDGSTEDFLGQDGVALAVGSPLGVAPYAYIQWAGGDGSNPADYRKHNYNMQSKTALLCDYVLRLPHVPATTTTESLTFGSPTDNVSASSALANLPVATNTVRTPMVFAGGSSATLFVNQVDSVSKVLADGDWHINQTTGVVSVYSSGAPGSITLTYRHYAAAPGAVSRFACALGALAVGDFLEPDANSNWVEQATPTTAAANWLRANLRMGQVVGYEVHPKSGLDRVRTAFNPAINTSATGLLPATSGQADQMPGSATGGVSDLIHFAGAADRIVLVNLISR